MPLHGGSFQIRSASRFGVCRNADPRRRGCTCADTQEGTSSLLIGGCCAWRGRGSAVIGLFLEGCGSQQSHPRIPLAAFHFLFLPSAHTLAAAPPLQRLGDPGTPGPGGGPPRRPHAQLQVCSQRDQMEESGELSCAMKEGALGTRENEGGEDAEELQRRRQRRRQRGRQRGRQGFLYRLNGQCQGAGRSAKRGAEPTGKELMKRAGLDRGAALWRRRSRPDGQRGAFNTLFILFFPLTENFVWRKNSLWFDA